MATIDDLIAISTKSSPIVPLRSTTFDITDTTPQGAQPIKNYVTGVDPFGAQSTPSTGEYSWDTPNEVYEFGRQRLSQQQRELGAVGANPVVQSYEVLLAGGPQDVRQAVWEKDIRVSGASGGSVIRNYSEETFDFQKRMQAAQEALNKKNWEREIRAARAATTARESVEAQNLAR